MALASIEEAVKDFQDGKIDAEAVYEWLGTEEGIVATPHSQRSVAQVQPRDAHAADDKLPDRLVGGGRRTEGADYLGLRPFGHWLRPRLAPPGLLRVASARSHLVPIRAFYTKTPAVTRL